jgi:hypothetical protein
VEYQTNGSLMIQFVRRRCPRVPYRMWIPKVLCRTGKDSVGLNIGAPLTILSHLKNFPRSLVGACKLTFLFWASCRLRDFQRFGIGIEKVLSDGFMTAALAVGWVLLVPKTRIDTCRCEVVLRERDDDADSNAHEVGLSSSCRRYAQLHPYRDRMSAALAVAFFW